MSRRMTADPIKPEAKYGRKPGRVTAAIVLLLAASGVALSLMVVTRRVPSIVAGIPTQSSETTPKLTKEYIYAGGRLIAIEEAVTLPVPAPAGLSATASVSALGGPSITVSWTPPAGAAEQVDHYEVERKLSLTDQPPFTFNCNGPPCPDPSAVESQAYLYRVRAVYVGGSRSDFSNHDLAATFPFTDDPLNRNGVGTLIRARHFTELREAVNAIRNAAGLLPFNWSGTTPQRLGPQSRGLIYASHFNDLRANLSEALGRLGLPGPQFAPVVNGDRVTHQPVQQLRDLTR